MKTRYESNNSGGHWWLSDDDWKNLEKAGWAVDWEEEERWLGALATSAKRDLPRAEAIREFEQITGQDSEEQGCPCCGKPHCFYEVK